MLFSGTSGNYVRVAWNLAKNRIRLASRGWPPLQYADYASNRKKTHYRRLWHHRRMGWHLIYDTEEKSRAHCSHF